MQTKHLFVWNAFCVVVTFPYGQVGYLIVSIPDICLLTYFSLAKQSSQKFANLEVLH